MLPRTKLYKVYRKQNFPALKVKFTVCEIESKITRHAKRQESILNEDNNQSVEIDTDIRISKEWLKTVITEFYLFIKLGRGAMESIKEKKSIFL